MKVFPTRIKLVVASALVAAACILPSCTDDMPIDDMEPEFGQTPDEYVQWLDENEVDYYLDEYGNPYTSGEKMIHFENGFDEEKLQAVIQEIAVLNDVSPDEIEVVDCGCGSEDFVLVRYQEKLDASLNPLIGNMGDPDGNNDGLSAGTSIGVSVVNNYYLAPLPQNLNLAGDLPVNFASPDPVIGSGFLANDDRIVIAILDSGFDFDHPTLSTYQNFKLWRSSPEDCYELGYDFVNHDGFADDQHGHGTQVGGIILETLQGFDVPVALMPLKISDATGAVTLWDMFCALGYAVSNGADVVNISAGWYGGPNRIIEQLIADHPEILFVCSAGNEGLNTDVMVNRHYPSGYTYFPNVISVAALDETRLMLADYSNYGANSISVGAPGTDLTTTTPCDGLICSQPLLVVQGTSFSAPVVAATAAAILHCTNTQPQDVRRKLYDFGIVNLGLQGKTQSGKAIEINLIPELILCRL